MGLPPISQVQAWKSFTLVTKCNTPIPNTEDYAKVPKLARYFPENPRTSKIIVRSKVKFLKHLNNIIINSWNVEAK